MQKNVPANNRHFKVCIQYQCSTLACSFPFFFFFSLQTDKTIRRIKTDLALDVGSLLARNSAGRSSWHGITDRETALNFDSDSTDKLKHNVLSEKEDERKNSSQDRSSQIITTGGDATDKAEYSVE